MPLLGSGVPDKLVIARPHRKLLALPAEVTALPLSLQGRRVALRSTGNFARAASMVARWPRDGMQELRIPKMMVVVAGVAAIRAGDYILHCPQGTMLFIPAGVPHTDSSRSHLETLPDTGYCSLLHLTPMISGLACRACHCTQEEHHGARQGEKVFFQRPHILQLFFMLTEEIGQEPMQPSPADGQLLDALLLALMRGINRDLLNQHYLLQEIAPETAHESLLPGDAVEKAISYINTHYARPLTLEAVARRFFLSRTLFTRKFRAHTGQSFLEYLNARRLEQARRLLVETEWTAVMITTYIGFSSPTYFHRLFLRETGMTPMQYRQQHRQNEEMD